jgi:hypothetical protein
MVVLDSDYKGMSTHVPQCVVVLISQVHDFQQKSIFVLFYTWLDGVVMNCRTSNAPRVPDPGTKTYEKFLNAGTQWSGFTTYDRKVTTCTHIAALPTPACGRHAPTALRLSATQCAVPHVPAMPLSQTHSPNHSAPSLRSLAPPSHSAPSPRSRTPRPSLTPLQTS